MGEGNERAADQPSKTQKQNWKGKERRNCIAVEGNRRAAAQSNVWGKGRLSLRWDPPRHWTAEKKKKRKKTLHNNKEKINGALYLGKKKKKETQCPRRVPISGGLAGKRERGTFAAFLTPNVRMQKRRIERNALSE